MRPIRSRADCQSSLCAASQAVSPWANLESVLGRYSVRNHPNNQLITNRAPCSFALLCALAPVS